MIAPLRKVLSSVLKWEGNPHFAGNWPGNRHFRIEKLECGHKVESPTRPAIAFSSGRFADQKAKGKHGPCKRSRH